MKAHFSGGAITSNGSAVLLRQADWMLGLTEQAARVLDDPRRKASLLVYYLRQSKIDRAKHAWAVLALLLKQLRQAWPNVEIVFRGANPRYIVTSFGRIPSRDALAQNPSDDLITLQNDQDIAAHNPNSASNVTAPARSKLSRTATAQISRIPAKLAHSCNIRARTPGGSAQLSRAADAPVDSHAVQTDNVGESHTF